MNSVPLTGAQDPGASNSLASRHDSAGPDSQQAGPPASRSTLSHGHSHDGIPAPIPFPLRAFVLWLLVLALAAWAGVQVHAGLSLAGRRLLLTSLAFGAMLGAIGAFGMFALPRHEARRMMRAASFAVAVLAAGGALQLTWLRYERFRDSSANRPLDPRAALAWMMLQQTQPDDLDVVQRFDRAMTPGPPPTMRDYLAFRIRRLGEWRSPGPELFFSIELLLTAWCAVFVLGRLTDMRFPRHVPAPPDAEEGP